MRRPTVRIILSAALAVICAGAWTMSFAADGCPKAPEKYTTLCASCHGPTGNGDGPAAVAFKQLQPPVIVRNFADAKYMKTRSDAQLINVIKNGGPAEKLSPFMAPMGAQFSSDKEIKEIVAFIRSLADPKCQAKKK